MEKIKECFSEIPLEKSDVEISGFCEFHDCSKCPGLYNCTYLSAISRNMLQNIEKTLELIKKGMIFNEFVQETEVKLKDVKPEEKIKIFFQELEKNDDAKKVYLLMLKQKYLFLKAQLESTVSILELYDVMPEEIEAEIEDLDNDKYQ